MRIDDDLITADEVEALQVFPKAWAFGWSAEHGSTQRFWNSPIVDAGSGSRQTVATPPSITGVVAALKKNSDDRLMRAYFNKHVSGIEPAVHRDTDVRHGQDYTAVVYLVPEAWSVEWGGETLVHYADGSVAATAAKRGRVITFDSGLQHQAKQPTPLCPFERVVAVFKFATRDPIEDFILARGWDSIVHKMHYTKRFADHLLETSGILRYFGAPPSVVAAGALHAAYGTQYFTPPNAPSREEVAALIGPFAEMLVHDFCKIDRAVIKERGSRELQLIAAANEYDKDRVRALLAQ